MNRCSPTINFAKSPRKSHKLSLNLSPFQKNKKNSKKAVAMIGSRNMEERTTKRKKDGSLKVIKRMQVTTVRNKGISSPKSSKKLRLTFKQNILNKAYLEEQNISYREYCIIGNKWIPLLTDTQRNKILNPSQVNSRNFQIVKPIEQTYYSFDPTNETFQSTFERFDEQSKDNINIEIICPQKKDYYRNILANIIKKLQKKPVNFEQQYHALQQQDLNAIKQPQQSNQIEFSTTLIEDCEEQFHHISNSCQNYNTKAVTTPENIVDENVYHLIKMRELSQLSLYPIEAELKESDKYQQEELINTGISCVKVYIEKILTVIQNTGLATQISNHLRVAWGFSRTEKLSRLRNKKSIGSLTQVLPDRLFQLTQKKFATTNIYQFIHNRCLFDCINIELNKLKPYYQSYGEAFRWNFRLFGSNLTFYDIGEETLPYAFQEIKMKVMEYSSYLCGILVDIDQNSAQNEIVQKRRLQREDNLMRKYLTGEQYKISQQNTIQNESTLIFLHASNLIFESLLQEVINFMHC